MTKLTIILRNSLGGELDSRELFFRRDHVELRDIIANDAAIGRWIMKSGDTITIRDPNEE